MIHRTSIGVQRFIAPTLMVIGLVWFVTTSDDRTNLLAINSLYLGTMTCLISLPLGTMLAAALLRTDMPGRRVLTLLVASLLFVPLYIQAAAWKAGFGTQGWVTEQIIGPGISPLLDGWRGAIWIHAVAAIPWVVLIVGVGLRVVPRQLEAAALLDAGTIRVLFRVTLPYVLGAIVAAAVWVTVGTFVEMTVTDLWALRTLAEELYTGFALGDTLQESRIRTAPAMMIVFFLTASAMVACWQWSVRNPTADRMTPAPLPLRRWRWPAAALTTSVVVVIVGVPFGNLVQKAGLVVTGLDGQIVRQWSLVKAVRMVATSLPTHADAFGWSVSLGILAATACLAIAIVLVWWARQRWIGAVAVLGITAFCLAVPGPLIGLTVAKLFSSSDHSIVIYLYDRTLAAPLLAVSIRCLPLAIAIVWYALATVPREHLEEAMLAGAGLWRQLWQVVIPQRLAALATAWLVVMAASMEDLTASAMTFPPLSRRIFGMIHAVVDDQLAALCLATQLMFLVVADLTAVILARRKND